MITTSRNKVNIDVFELDWNNIVRPFKKIEWVSLEDYSKLDYDEKLKIRILKKMKG